MSLRNLLNRTQTKSQLLVTTDGIYASGYIDEYELSASAVVTALNGMRGQPATIHLNSPGGDVFEGRAIQAAIAAHDADVTVIIEGVCASAATYPAMAAKTVKMTASSLLMIHDSWTLAMGNKADLAKVIDLLDKIDGTIVDSYAKRTGMARNAVIKAMADETWYTAEEAKAAGFIDEIIPDTQQENQNAWDLSAYKNAPKPDLTAEIARQKQRNSNRLRLINL